ncbi:MAG: hypothetical protein MUC41_10630 [Syntrophobacteraceae bacterium]|nr:hypothetical protein [Syntrophobacteraceae bacterium]
MLGAAVLFFAHAPFLAFILMSLPAIFSGVVALLHGIAVLSTRIVISGSQISLVVPEWRGFPVLPVRRVSVKWDEFLAIRHRKEVYRLFAAFSFPVEIFALDTSRGRIVLAERSLPGIRQILTQVIGRTGLVIQEEGEVTVGLFQVLLKGSPPWRGEQRPTGSPS